MRGVYCYYYFYRYPSAREVSEGRAVEDNIIDVAYATHNAGTHVVTYLIISTKQILGQQTRGQYRLYNIIVGVYNRMYRYNNTLIHT